jgi:hypothetical protein
MKAEEFGARLGDLVRDVDPVPEVPREEIWAHVAAARRFRRPTRRPGLWFIRAASLAATLVLGFSIGRVTVPGPEGEPVELPTARTTDPVALQTSPPAPPGAADYLTRTAALLTSFPTSARRGRADEVAEWARQLLLDTRLLIDEPAGGNADLTRLLQDLELVLAQIALLPAINPQREILLIQDGIRQNQVMTRLKLAAGAAVTNGDD